MSGSAQNTHASASKGDPIGGCLFTGAEITNETQLNSILSAMDDYVSGTGDSDYEAVTSGFKYCSDVSDSGVVLSEDSNTTEHKDMDGDTVLVTFDSRSETAKLSLIDITEAALAEVYGQDNVSSKSGVITIHHNAKPMPNRSAILLIALSDGRRKAVLIPRFAVTGRGEEKLLSSDLDTRELTLTTYKCPTGDTIIEKVTGIKDSGTGTKASGSSTSINA